MLKNLLQTWADLAPDEVKVTQAEIELVKTLEWDHYSDAEFADLGFVLKGESSHTGKVFYYLQQCIQDRGWLFSAGICEDSEPNYFGDVWVNGEADFCRHAPSIVEALLYSSLTALAVQRPITTGQWRHFKGDVAQVVAGSRWSGEHIIPEYLSDFYTLEDQPSRVLQICSNQGLYRANKDYGDCVFYIEPNGKRWARKTDIFLGLVGQNQEHEGLLRFVEVK